MSTAVVAWYNFKAVTSIFRLTRNLATHQTDARTPKRVQDALGGSSSKTVISEMFCGIFPRLLVLTWLVMSDEVEQEPGLEKFYPPWYRERAAFIYQSLTDGIGRSPYRTGMWPQCWQYNFTDFQQYGIGLRPAFTSRVPTTSFRSFKCTEEPDDWSQPQVSNNFIVALKQNLTLSM